MRRLSLCVAAAVVLAGSGSGTAGEPGPWVLAPSAVGDVWVPLGLLGVPGAPANVPGGPPTPGVPAVPAAPSAVLESILADGAILRLDARPPGGAVAVDGNQVVGAGDGRVPIVVALPPGQHVLEMLGPGGVFRFTLEVRAATRSGYHVVPRP